MNGSIVLGILGQAAADGLVGEQAASLAEAVGMDSEALDATQALNQFTDILMWPSCIQCLEKVEHGGTFDVELITEVCWVQSPTRT